MVKVPVASRGLLDLTVFCCFVSLCPPFFFLPLVLHTTARETLVSEWEELVEELCLSPDDNSFDGNMHELHALMTDEIKPQKDAEMPIGLTIVDLGAIGDRVSELGEEKERRLALITKLGQQITTLWEKLNIDQEERDSFFAMHDHLGQKEIDACQSELERLTALKKERVRPMIMNERTAITELWNKLHYSTEQQNDFGQFTTTEDLFNEDVLEQHEVYHQKLVEQWNVQEPIMALIEKREKILTLPQKIRDIKNFKKGDPNPEKPGKTLTSGDMSKMLQKRKKNCLVVCVPLFLCSSFPSVLLTFFVSLTINHQVLNLKASIKKDCLNVKLN